MAGGKASHVPRAEDLADRAPFRWRPREIAGLARAAGREFVEDKCPKQSAAVSYYTLFALGPLLVLAIGMAALVFGADAARGAVMAELTQLLGSSGAEGISELLTGADRERVGIVGTIVGFLVLAFSAGAVFGQLKEALDRIWEVEVKKSVGLRAKLVHAVRKNLLSFAGVMGTGFLLLVSLVMSAGLTAMGDMLEGMFPAAQLVWQIVNALVSIVVIGAVFAAIFKLLPDARVAWRDVLVGGLVTSVLFTAGQIALGAYIGAGGLAVRYGAAGAVLVILVWVYYSSMILFFGAELTQVYANRYGSKVRESNDARPLTEAIQEEQAEPEKEGTTPRRRPSGGAQ